MLVLKVIRQLSITVDLSTFLPRPLQQRSLSLIFQSPFTEWPLEPRIETAWMNRQHAAHAADIQLQVMPFDERIPHFASLAKYAVAFFKMLRTSMTRASSCFSCLIALHHCSGRSSIPLHPAAQRMCAPTQTL
jgi:hypothetical protein